MGVIYELMGPSWRLPISVMWIDTLAEITIGAGVQLLNIQQKAAHDFLISNYAQEKVGHLYIYEADLRHIARPIEHVDPELIVEWLPPRKPVEVEGDYKAPDDFIQEYCRSSYALIRDSLAVDAIWTSLCKFMLHWFLNEQKPVNLTFIKLVPLCFRKNWSNAVARWERRVYGTEQCTEKKRPMLTKDFQNQDQQSMVNRGVAEYLCSSGVSALDNEHKVLRNTVSIILLPEFHEASLKVELKRKAHNRGGWAYWLDTIPNRLRRQLPLALEVYSHDLAEATLPTAYIHKSNDYSDPNQPEGREQSAKNFKSVKSHVATVHDAEDRNVSPDWEGDKAQSLAQPNPVVLHALSGI